MVMKDTMCCVVMIVFLGHIADLAPVNISADILTFLLLHIETSGDCDWLALLSLGVNTDLREENEVTVEDINIIDISPLWEYPGTPAEPPV